MRLFLFILAVVALFLVPNPEALVIKLVEYAGLVLIVARGLAGYYEDLVKVLEGNKKRATSIASAQESTASLNQ